MSIDKHIPSDPLLNKIFLGDTSVDINAFKKSNIFTEHHMLVQRKQLLEQRQDWYGAIHCSNLISILPMLSDVPLYKIHITWFEDRYILYASCTKQEDSLPLETNLLETNHCSTPSKPQIQKFPKFLTQFRVLGIIEDI